MATCGPNNPAPEVFESVPRPFPSNFWFWLCGGRGGGRGFGQRGLYLERSKDERIERKVGITGEIC